MTSSEEISSPKNGILVKREALGLQLPQEEVRFGVIPVDKQQIQELMLKNTEGTTLFVHVSQVENNYSGMLDLRIHPLKPFILEAGEERTVQISLIMIRTMSFTTRISVRTWHEGESSFREVIMNLSAESRKPINQVHPSDLHVDENDVLGEGGFARVYRGWYHEGKEVAVKRPRSIEFSINEDQEDQEQIEREVGILADYENDTIVEFIGAMISEERKIVGIVTELCQYGSLDKAFYDHPEAFDEEMKMKVLVDVSSAMLFLHNNDIIHRDLKPGNVLIVSLDPRSHIVAKISDFGTARSLSRGAELTKNAGTEFFMAPEVKARKHYTISADVYSFGVLMLFMYTKKKDRKSVFLRIGQGHPPEAPSYCPPFAKDLMTDCWNRPSKRPAFETIHNDCQQHLIELRKPIPDDWVTIKKDTVDDEFDEYEPITAKGVSYLFNTLVSKLFRGIVKY